MESNVLLAQCPYFPALSLNVYMCSAGLPRSMWLVIRLVMCARNIGAAAAMVGANFDQGITIPLVAATLVTVIALFAIAPMFARISRCSVSHTPAVSDHD